VVRVRVVRVRVVRVRVVRVRVRVREVSLPAQGESCQRRQKAEEHLWGR
jgi:hypothetical protein